MKAISICGPWWWYILQGIKPVENRSWSHSHRGLLLIQVSQKILEADRVAAQDMAKRAGWTGGVPTPAELQSACGYIMGMVTMVDVVDRHSSPFFQGRYGHVYARPVLFREPVRCRGMQGIFEVDDALLPAIARAPVAGLTKLDFAADAPADTRELERRTFMGADIAAEFQAPAPLPSDPLQRRMF